MSDRHMVMAGRVRTTARRNIGDRRTQPIRSFRAALAAAALALAGCATGEPNAAPAEVADNDPAEPVNRAIFDANMAVDRAVVKPVARLYRDGVPDEVRTGVHNVAANLKEPGITANDLLQGNVNRAWTSARRFAVNTTAGV